MSYTYVQVLIHTHTQTYATWYPPQHKKHDNKELISSTKCSSVSELYITNARDAPAETPLAPASRNRDLVNIEMANQQDSCIVEELIWNTIWTCHNVSESGKYTHRTGTDLILTHHVMFTGDNLQRFPWRGIIHCDYIPFNSCGR